MQVLQSLTYRHDEGSELLLQMFRQHYLRITNTLLKIHTITYTYAQYGNKIKDTSIIELFIRLIYTETSRNTLNIDYMI